MTASKVAQISSMLNSPEFLKVQKQSQEETDAFGALLNYTASAGGGKADLFSGRAEEKAAGTDIVNKTVYEKESAKSGYRENSISQNENSQIENKIPEDVQDKLKDFEGRVKETVAEKLGISQEELTQQMEIMGLTVLDLMDPSKLADLVMELTGTEDIGSLLFSEDFQQLLGQISELSQEFAVQLNVTPEEMKQLLPQLENMLSEGKEEAVLNEDSEAGQLKTMVEEENPEAEKKTEVLQTSVQEAAGVQKEAPQEVSDTQKGERTEEINVHNPESRQESEEAGSDTDSNSMEEESYTKLNQDTKGTDKTENRQTHVTYQTTAQTVNQGQTVEVTQTVVQTKVNVEDVLRQVSQMTRVLVSQAESSIEMQLNPENLGKVYLQVVSREGVITAQIAAQNEAVKEALESQIVTLRENMNQQGIKVEAIEVTIASHEFERNLEENQQNSTQQQESEAQKSGRRNLNLNSLDELEGIMTEEENLAAKIMTEQGNSMDITI